MKASKPSPGTNKSPDIILGVIACFDLQSTWSGPGSIPAIVPLVALEMLVPHARPCYCAALPGAIGL